MQVETNSSIDDLRILFVDDDADDIALHVRRLNSEGIIFDWRSASKESELRDALTDFSPSIVLCDFMMPGFSGIRALEVVQESSPTTPLIFVSGTIQEETAVSCLQAGAVDYILKNRPQRLGPAILRAVSEARARTDYESHLHFLANHDTLTALPNREVLADRLAQALSHRKLDGHHAALITVNIDGFRFLDGALGRARADEALREVAARIRTCIRGDDMVARIGSDEFTVLLSYLTVPDDANAVASRLLEAIRRPCSLSGHEISMSASAGVAISPLHGEHAETLIRNATAALHRAKALSRGGFQIASVETMREMVTQVELDTGLRRALESQELFLQYQPQHDLVSGALCGLEVLMRWARADGTLVAPADFIPVAEKTGLICQMGEWALRTACARAKPWLADAPSSFILGVNVSARQLADVEFPDVVARALASTGFPPDRLELELTESGLLSGSGDILQVLSRLKDLGVQIAIDDFGTGYSSLSYLSRMPIDRIKIDASFVRRMTTDARDFAIVQSIVSLGQSLGFRVIAEGIETQAQKDALLALCCREGQGYLFSPPIPEERVPMLIRRASRELESASQARPPSAPSSDVTPSDEGEGIDSSMYSRVAHEARSVSTR